MSGTFHPDDTIFLLKEIELPFSSIAEKEEKIRGGGAHYSELVIREEAPDETYLALFNGFYARYADRLAGEVASLAFHLHETCEDPIVLVSLARAGTPVGAMLGRCLRQRWRRDCQHFSISIIRDKGLDENALRYLLCEKKYPPASLIFVDGWTGKGAIRRELSAAIRQWNERQPGFQLADRLLVISDIGGVADVAATVEDYPMPFGLLNSTVCGLISRTVLNEQFLTAGDFHGTVVYRHLAAFDQTNSILEDMANRAMKSTPTAVVSTDQLARQRAAMDVFLRQITRRFGVAHPNHVKPGVAESARALLRRQPSLLLLENPDAEEVRHLALLAGQKNVPVMRVENMPVRATALLSGAIPVAV